MTVTRYEDHDPGSGVRGCVIGIIVSVMMILVSIAAAYGAYVLVNRVW